MWAPSSKVKEEPSASGSFVTIAASVLGCAAIFLKVRYRLWFISHAFTWPDRHICPVEPWISWHCEWRLCIQICSRPKPQMLMPT